jgi:menaquinone-dependent protoporphyrinogen IX oxidase
MNGAIFFSGKYGSTAQYADWISDATGLPVFDVNRSDVDPSQYGFLVLGSSIVTFRPTIRKWVQRHLATIERTPTILFTVSGAPAGPKLDGWIADSLPKSLVAHLKHVALGGRQDPKALSWVDWTILRMGAMMNSDPKARKEELHGFDFMDKSSIEPIVKMVRELQDTEKPVPGKLERVQ